MRVSANLRRFQSRFLMEEYRRGLLIERSTLKALLPEEINKDPVLFAAIETSASFQTWRRLRQDSDLAPHEAGIVFLLMLERLLGA